MKKTWIRLTSGKVWHIAHDMRDGLIQAKCGEVLDHGIVRRGIFDTRFAPACKKCWKFYNASVPRPT